MSTSMRYVFPMNAAAVVATLVSMASPSSTPFGRFHRGPSLGARDRAANWTKVLSAR